MLDRKLLDPLKYAIHWIIPMLNRNFYHLAAGILIFFKLNLTLELSAIPLKNESLPQAKLLQTHFTHFWLRAFFPRFRVSNPNMFTLRFNASSFSQSHPVSKPMHYPRLPFVPPASAVVYCPLLSCAQTTSCSQQLRVMKASVRWSMMWVAILPTKDIVKSFLNVFTVTHATLKTEWKTRFILVQHCSRSSRKNYIHLLKSDRMRCGSNVQYTSRTMKHGNNGAARQY